MEPKSKLGSFLFIILEKIYSKSSSPVKAIAEKIFYFGKISGKSGSLESPHTTGMELKVQSKCLDVHKNFSFKKYKIHHLYCSQIKKIPKMNKK